MSPITTKEELKQCRDRNNKLDVMHETVNAKACDEYTCTKAKARRNELDFAAEIARLTKGVCDD